MEYSREISRLPTVWAYYTVVRPFCFLSDKDDTKNGAFGITGEWGSGFYAESEDCRDFTVGNDPKVYSRTVTWADGRVSTQGNLERPSVLFDENGTPTHIFCASGDGPSYAFNGRTYIVCLKLEKK